MSTSAPFVLVVIKTAHWNAFRRLAETLNTLRRVTGIGHDETETRRVDSMDGTGTRHFPTPRSSRALLLIVPHSQEPVLTGDVVRARVRVSLPDEASDPVQLLTLTTRLIWSAADSRWGKDHTCATIRLSGGLVTAAVPFEVTVEVKIPDDGPVSSTGRVVTVRWSLAAEAELSWGHTVTATMPLVVGAGPLAGAQDPRGELVHTRLHRVQQKAVEVAFGTGFAAAGTTLVLYGGWTVAIGGVCLALAAAVGLGLVVDGAEWLRWRHARVRVVQHRLGVGDDVDVVVDMPTHLELKLELIDAEVRCTEVVESSPHEDDERINLVVWSADVPLESELIDVDSDSRAGDETGRPHEGASLSVYRGRVQLPAHLAPTLLLDSHRVEWAIVARLHRVGNTPIVITRLLAVHPASARALPAPATGQRG